MNSVKFIKSLSVGALPWVALVLVGCSKPAPVEEPVRAVKVMTVGAQGMQSGLEFAGEVRARVESRLGFQVAGKVTRRLVEVGQRVKAGELLAQLDPQDYKLAAEAGQAQVALASTNRNLAAADFKRYKALKDQNFISGAELERRETTLIAAQAQLEQAQAQLSAQKNQAGYTSLLADGPGVVVATDAEAGQVVAAGSPVVRVARDGVRDVAFSVPEDKVALLKVGSFAEVRGWASSAAFKGVVREVAASADPVTRTFLVKLSLDAQDAPALGTTVTVVPKALDRGGVQVIKLPTTALRQDGQASAVWLLDPATMTVKLQTVQVATADGNEVVIASGLQPGMQVVAAGVHVLSPGQKVSIYKENGAPALTGIAQAAPKLVAASNPGAAASASAPLVK